MTSRFQPPPIIKAAERLLVDIENAVRRFDRYHKYSTGEDLRREAKEVMKLATRAWREREPARRGHWTGELVATVDDLKQTLQVAKLLRAFRSFKHFEYLARQAVELGQQVGGWHRQQSPEAQNAGARQAVPQRGKKLSTRAASAGANP